MPKGALSFLPKILKKLAEKARKKAEDYHETHKHRMESFRSELAERNRDLSKFRESIEDSASIIATIVKEAALITIPSLEAAEQAEAKVVGKSSPGAGGGRR